MKVAKVLDVVKFYVVKSPNPSIVIVLEFYTKLFTTVIKESLLVH